MEFLHKAGSIIVSAALALSSFFGWTTTANVGASIPQAPALFETSLNAAIGTGDTTMTLVSNSLRGGLSLSGYSCFTLDQGLSNVEYVCGIASSTNVTSLTRGIDPITGITTVTALKQSHRRGANVKITDYPILGILSSAASGITGYTNALFYDSAPSFSTSTQIVTKGYVDATTSALDVNNVKLTGNQTIAGIKTFSSLPTIPAVPSANTDAASKGYVDGIAFAGAPNASTVQKGIVQEATAADVANGTATGSTGARLYINPSNVSPGANVDFGTGLDGNSLFDGSATYSYASLVGSTYTLTRDLYASAITVNNGITLRTGGYIVHTVSTITNNGTIDNSGANASNGNNASGSTGGTGGAFGASGLGATLPTPPSSTSGGNGGNQESSGTGSSAGVAANPSLGSSGVAGGSGGTVTGYSGGTAAAGGTTTAETASISYIYTTKTLVAGSEVSAARFLARIVGSTSGATTSASASSSGGGGGAGARALDGGGAGGGGGGAGGVGGNILLVASSIVNNGTISVNGGNGGNGGNSSIAGGRGGGGAGGSGGVILMIYNTYSGSGSLIATGGTGGTAGSGGGTANAGTTGNAGKIYRAKLSNYSFN